MLFERIESEGLAHYSCLLKATSVLGSLPVPRPIKPRRFAGQAEEEIVLDVRSMAELAGEGEIVDSHHIHITQLPHHLADIPRHREIPIFCGSGLRSKLAASYLQREGWEPVKVVLGGTKGWNSTACPLKL